MKLKRVLRVFIPMFMAFLLVGGIIYASLVFFNRSFSETRNESVLGTARAAADIIDGDKVDGWISDGSDPSYEETGVLLKKILKNTPDMESLYVCRYSKDGYTIVYDYFRSEDDTGIGSGEELGSFFTDDGALQLDLDRLVAGEEVSDSIVLFNGYKNIFVPVYDSQGRCVAHVGADYSVQDITEHVAGIIKRIAVLAVVFMIICFLIGIHVFISLRKSDALEQEIARAKKDRHLFEETALALSNAIDAKDKYTHGHSKRVAEYSKKIAKLAGKSDDECELIYYAGLLHDVGKIGVPEAIITKEGRLTQEEYEAVKQHSTVGADILKDITEYPYLSIGARYHHERYDGKGYPDRLVGDDIPDVARIIAVADAYDAMTSTRSYRKTIPQQKVREEFVACAGTQFDPEYANIMVHLIDIDTKYKMKEIENNGPTIRDELIIGDHRDVVSRGVSVLPYTVTIGTRVRPLKTGSVSKPSLIFFDSLDGRFHDDEHEVEEFVYYEYCELGFDGKAVNKGVRKIDVRRYDSSGENLSDEYLIEAVRVEDHALIKITGQGRTVEYTIALPDSSRFTYMAFSGENCIMSEMTLERSDVWLGTDYIPRIAPKISFIDAPEGDIPNVQVDRYRSATSEAIPVDGNMTVSFHTKSLPTARLIWHCPFCVIYSSDDGTVTGDNYVEYALIRLDGETWESGGVADNDLVVSRQDFEGWEHWRKINKEGYDVTITLEKNGDTIVAHTENAGISIRNTTVIKEHDVKVYAALTGDQCALTGIRIDRS